MKRIVLAAIAGLAVGALTYAGLWWAMIDPLQWMSDPDEAFAYFFVRTCSLAAGVLSANSAYHRLTTGQDDG